MDKTGGEFYLHRTLFQYFDNCHANIGDICTNFNNVNVLYTGRPTSKLDCSAMPEVALAYKTVKNHFDQLIALNRVDSTDPSICGMTMSLSASPRSRTEPEP